MAGRRIINSESDPTLNAEHRNMKRPPSSSTIGGLPPMGRALFDLAWSPKFNFDHPHRDILADSGRCSRNAHPSLPLPSSTSLHRRRHGSPAASHPFRQYTRLTLSLDSAAAASALASSAGRVLHTYDIVAARSLTQAAFDHLCEAQPTTELDIISIDFSHKMPFRLKLPMVKLALQRGLHFEIVYAPLINDVNSRRHVLAEAKILVDWTRGKNIIISSSAHTANEIRGPYDVINLCACLLGLSTQQAKAAISLNCRSLIFKALRKKHFYKETIRTDRLLPNEQYIGLVTQRSPQSEEQSETLPSEDLPETSPAHSFRTTEQTLSNDQMRLQDFINEVSHKPESPLIHTPPCRNNLETTHSEDQSVIYKGKQFTPRKSARLAIKAKNRLGTNKGTIKLAQELLAAKLKDLSPPPQHKNSQDDLFEQFASHFEKPLSKEKVEAILQLVNQGMIKQGGRKKANTGILEIAGETGLKE